MSFEERRSAAMLASRVVDNFTENGIPDRWLDTILNAFGGRELCEEVERLTDGNLNLLGECDQLRAEVGRITAERDRAREECGHERHMRGFNSEERDRWVRKFIEGEAERDQLRASLKAAHRTLRRAIYLLDTWTTNPGVQDETNQMLRDLNALSTDNQGADDR